MILVIGGAYQGKLFYVQEHFLLENKDVFSCKSGQCEITTNKQIIYGLEHFILSQVKSGKDSILYMKDNMKFFQDKIIICEDASCGIVPISKEMRAYREASGRTLSYLAGQADEVIRVFCGIGSKIK